MKNRILLLICLGLFLGVSCQKSGDQGTSGRVTVVEDSLLVPTYVVNPPNPMPRFYEGQAHQGVQRRYYPYPMNDNLTRVKEDRNYHIIYLENEFIKIGIIPGDIAIPGNVGLVSRSGTLTYEIAYLLKQAGIGVSVCIGIGGDPVLGTGFSEVLDQLETDPDTEKVVLIGEIGGQEEQKAAEVIAKGYSKPVTAFIAGQTAPPGVRMGHAGAIIERGSGSAQDKIVSLEAAGVKVARLPEEIPALVA